MKMSIQEATCTSLLIHNFPNVLSKEDLREFLKHFGPVTSTVQSNDSKKGTLVHARFQTTAAAKAALIRLHQLNILGNRLKVEFTDVEASGTPLSDPDTSFSTEKAKLHDVDRGAQFQQAFLRSLTSWTSNIDLNRPPPIHLRYQYPPPNSRTLKNISNALAANPRLYTQLLHLMNRMNLPAPFEEDKQFEQETQTEDHWFISDSTEESEYESDPDENAPNVDKDTRKRPPSQPTKRVRKTIPLIKRARLSVKTPTAPPSTKTPAVRPEEVFEKPDAGVTQKKIELKLAPSASANPAVQEVEPTSDVGSFGLLYPSKENVETTDENQTTSAEDEEKSTESGDFVITAEQLAQNRLSAKDLKVLPLFQKYQPGAPSCRLYIKNVAKKVESKDLHFIYRRYLQMASPEQAVMFDVRLMTEGRMKGQAFVTLPTKELAQQALQETNGYILKDKPLCVQFARSAPTVPGSS